MELPEEACDTIVPVIEIGNNAKEIQLEIELFFNALLKIKFFYSLGKIIGSSTRFILSLIEQIFDAWTGSCQHILDIWIIIED